MSQFEFLDFPVSSLQFHITIDNPRISQNFQHFLQGYFDPSLNVQVVEGFYNGISTAEVDTLAAETCAYMPFDLGWT